MQPPPSRLRALLLDLDGVLVDSVPPLRVSFGAAMTAMGRPPLTDDQVRPLIGPPLETSASIALGEDDPAVVATFVEHFRATYDTVFLTHTQPADALLEVVGTLAQSVVLVVATSKPEAYAVPLLEHLGVSTHLRAIVGRSLALDHDTKAAVIGRALTHLPGIDPAEEVVMVGDRRHDVEGARAHGIPTVGVLHGSGTEEELREAGARWIVPDLRGLASWMGLRPAETRA